MMRKNLVATFCVLAAIALPFPALADVKAGVDAWERGDYPAAVNEWRPLAIKGDADAQFNLGQAYRFGRGVPADMKQAEDWYRQAAAQGHFQAEDNLGLIMFQNGDRQGAMPLIQHSADRGDPRAQYVLGTALFNGDIVERDWISAYALMTRASAAGLAPASSSLAQMDRFIPMDQRQKGLYRRTPRSLLAPLTCPRRRAVLSSSRAPRKARRGHACNLRCCSSLYDAIRRLPDLGAHPSRSGGARYIL